MYPLNEISHRLSFFCLGVALYCFDKMRFPGKRSNSSSSSTINCIRDRYTTNIMTYHKVQSNEKNQPRMLKENVIPDIFRYLQVFSFFYHRNSQSLRLLGLHHFCLPCFQFLFTFVLSFRF